MKGLDQMNARASLAWYRGDTLKYVLARVLLDDFCIATARYALIVLTLVAAATLFLTGCTEVVVKNADGSSASLTSFATNRGPTKVEYDPNTKAFSWSSDNSATQQIPISDVINLAKMMATTGAVK